MRLREHSVRSKVPILRVATGDILLHPKECSLRLVFSVTHIPEFLQIRLDILLGVRAAVAWRSALFSSSLKLDFGLVAVANVCLLYLDELLGEVI